MRPRSLPLFFLTSLALALLLMPGVASAEWIDLGGEEPVTVEVLENSDTRTVYAITIGGFEAEPITLGNLTWYDIQLGGESRADVQGYPELPDVRRALSIPDDRAMLVRIVESEFVDIPDMPVVPSKGNLLRSVDPKTVDYTFNAFYQGDGVWPEDVLIGEDPHIVRDLRGMVVDANVFQYFPGQTTLRVYTRLVIEVADAGTGRVNVLNRDRDFAQVDPQFAHLYDRHFINGTPTRYVPVEESGGLLIIADDAFASSMLPLVEWKLQKGLDTRLLTTSETGSSFSQIKAAITTAFNDWAPASVLLVGDLAQIPIGSDSDPEYSTVLGTDNYPDLFVGRFSAENTSHVQTQVLRTIAYERDLGSAEVFAQYATGVASNEGPGDDGEYDYEHLNNIRDDLLGAGYLGVDQFYQPSATASMVTNALNTGRGFINYTGHGSSTAWSTTGFSNTHVNALHNQGMLPFITSVACNNGTFTGTCFAEAWLRATDGGVPSGAIATYMSYISQSWNPPMSAQDEIVDLLAADAMHTTGGLWFNGSCLMMDEYGSSGANEFLNWTIFGDPSLMVRTRAPEAMTVSHTGVLMIGMSEYEVQTGTPGALCALYADGVLYGSAVADGAGHAVIAMAMPPTVPMTLTLTVTASNKVTMQDTLPVLPPEGPYLVFETAAVDDTAGDGDLMVDVGETIALTVELENVGVEGAANLVATLISDDPFITIDEAASTYPDIPAAGIAACVSPFAFTALGGAPDGYVAQLTVQVTDGIQVWDANFSLPFQAPDLAMAGQMIYDDLGGNGSGTADAGEYFALVLSLANSGASDAVGVSAELFCDDPYIDLNGELATADLIPTGGTTELSLFNVHVYEDCPEPSMLTFTVTVTAASGHTQDLEFEVAVGGWMDDMESDRGWTIGTSDDTASAGLWERADPVGTNYNGTVVQMEDDHSADPGTQCFVTGNGSIGGSAGSADVDGGQTTLLSPVFDLEGATQATLSYWRWYTNDVGNNPGEDWWDVEVTSDGENWVSLEHTQESATSWQQFTFQLTEYVPATSHVQLRFIASDAGGGSLVEAGVDDLFIDPTFSPTTAVDGEDRRLPQAVALDGNYPNPFNPATKIVFALPRTGEVELAVFDIAGRRVATLVSGVVEAGEHDVTWTGRDDRGGEVASGIYFSRLVADGVMKTQKMTLLK